MDGDNEWREYSDPTKALAVVTAARDAGLSEPEILRALDVGESTIRMWGVTVQQLRPRTARAVRRLDRRVARIGR